MGKVKKNVVNTNKSIKKPNNKTPNTTAAGNEIDQIFEKLGQKKNSTDASPNKRDKKNRNYTSAAYLVKNEEFESKKSVVVSSTDRNETYGLISSDYKSIKIVNPEAPLERIDAESGLPVYKAHLLKVGEGGGTDLCPFDCNCCF
eukprot:gene8779-11855_t